MKKYIVIDWPDVQEYMEHPDWKEQHYFDPIKNIWLIPEIWIDPYAEMTQKDFDEMMADSILNESEIW